MIFFIFIAGVYTSFAVVLIILRKCEMVFDKRDLPLIIYEARQISFGWSVYVGWIASFLCLLSGATWIVFYKELRKAHANYTYKSKYDQICSMQ